MAHIFNIISLVIMVGCTSSSVESVDHLRAAKNAEASLHAACDAYAASRDQDEKRTAAAANISRSYFDFMRHVLETDYTPNAAILVPRQFAGAGAYVDREGAIWSWFAGKGQSGFIVAMWKREEWADGKVPPHGFALTVGLESEEQREAFEVGKATWIDDAQTVLRVPYSIGSNRGAFTVETAEDEWLFNPDRGVLGPGNWWRVNDQHSPE